MFTTNYANMKKHFDRLIKGGYPVNTGLEPLRTIYERMFDISIGELDIYESDLFVPNNSIKKIVTLIGPKKENKIIPLGLICANDSDIYYINHLSIDELRNDEDMGNLYIRNIYHVMKMILKFDNSFKYGAVITVKNPYLTLLNLYPFYFTFYHIYDSFPEWIDSETFANILEESHCFIKTEDIPKILESLKTNKYSDHPEDIYMSLTCKNTISFE